MADTSRLLTAAEFPNASAAADHAREAAIEAHDFALVVSLALSTEGGHITIAGQEAICTVAQHAAAKLREARDAIDLASGMFRTGARHG